MRERAVSCQKRARRGALRGLVLALLAALAGLGCSDAGIRASRYRAEKMLWKARRAEQVARLAPEGTQSAALLRAREAYSGLRAAFPPPYREGGSVRARAVGGELTRLVATAELSGARLALAAGRPDLALEQAGSAAGIATSDSVLARRADFFRVAVLRHLGHIAQLESLMVAMLERYPPQVPERPDQEDPILTLPDALIALRNDLGEAEGVRAARARAEAYYRRLLTTPRPPALRVQIGARLTRVLLEQERWADASREVESLEAAALSTPAPESYMPEILYSKAKIRSRLERDPSKAVAILEHVASTYPASPFAPLALFDAGITFERQKRYGEAVERYRTVVARFPNDTTSAPVALFRQAMLEERLGNWEAGKRALESLPVRYPGSRAALEAPLAVADRYVRIRRPEEAGRALRRAIQTYEGLIARDTLSRSAPLYRFSIFVCQSRLQDWDGALQTAETLAARYPTHPVTAQTLLDAAAIARSKKGPAQESAYLKRFLAAFPESRIAPQVRRALEGLKPPS